MANNHAICRYCRMAFGGYEPFHLCLLLGPNGDIHKLVRAAEPPLHDELDVGRLSKSDAERLRQAFDRIRDQLKDRLAKINTTSFQWMAFCRCRSATGSGGDSGTHPQKTEVFDRRPKPTRGETSVDIGEDGPEPEAEARDRYAR